MESVQDKYNQLFAKAKEKKKTGWGKPSQAQDANLTSDIVEFNFIRSHFKQSQ